MADCCGRGCVPCVLDPPPPPRARPLAASSSSSSSSASSSSSSSASSSSSSSASSSSSSSSEAALSPSEYRPFTVLRLDRAGPRTVRVQAALPAGQRAAGVPPGQHVVMRVEGVVSRLYTPVGDPHDPDHIELLIKTAAGTAMDAYVGQLRVGDAISLRGPVGLFAYTRGVADRLVLVVSGVGVAPSLALLQAIVNDPHDETLVDLVVAMHAPDCATMQLVGATLRDLAAYWNVRLRYVFSAPGPPVASTHGGARAVVQGQRLSAALLARLLPDLPPARCIAAVCGGPGFEAAMAASLAGLGVTDVRTFAAGGGSGASGTSAAAAAVA